MSCLVAGVHVMFEWRCFPFYSGRNLGNRSQFGEFYPFYRTYVPVPVQSSVVIINNDTFHTVVVTVQTLTTLRNLLYIVYLLCLFVFISQKQSTVLHK